MNQTEKHMRYKDFAPTTLDPKGLHADELGIGDWFVVPVMRDRDREPFHESNFQTALEMLKEVDPDQEDHQELRFGHWGPGWFEIIVVRPGTEAEKVYRKIVDMLEEYPILDDEDLSEREWKEFEEIWESDGAYDLARLLQKRFGFGNALFDFLVEHSDALMHRWLNHAPEPYFMDGNHVAVRLGDYVDDLFESREDFAQFVRELRKQD